METVSANMSHNKLTNSSKCPGFYAQFQVVIGDVSEED